MVYIEQLHLILEESVSQNLWGSQGKLCKENLGYCPEVFFYPPLLKRSIFSSHILPVIQKRHEYCTTFNVHKVINQSLKEGSLLSCVFLKSTYLKKTTINLPLLGQAKL